VVIQVHETVQKVEHILEQVVTWREGEDGMQRGNVASACREVEEVGVTIFGKVAYGGTRELGLEDG